MFVGDGRRREKDGVDIVCYIHKGVIMAGT